jgi:hypothetical protein
VGLPKADLTLRIVEGEVNPSRYQASPDLPISLEAVDAIEAFLTVDGLASSET